MDRQDKKAQFEKKGEHKFSPLLVVVIVLLVTAAAGVGAWFMRGDSSGGVRLQAVDGRIAVPLAQIADGKAHFFTFGSGASEIRFFLLKSHDGIIRAAFDTCDVCYRAQKGYRQEGDEMVCNNCEQRFRSDRINEVKGGCNPAPLDRSVEGDRVVIAEVDLAEGAWYFQ